MSHTSSPNVTGQDPPLQFSKSEESSISALKPPAQNYGGASTTIYGISDFGNLELSRPINFPAAGVPMECLCPCLREGNCCDTRGHYILICETYNSNAMCYKSFNGSKSKPIQNGDGAKVALVKDQKVDTKMRKPMGDWEGSELVDSDSE